MVLNSSGRGSGGHNKRKENVKIADEFKDVCPKHRIKDLDGLVKLNKGNREKIREQVAEWWDETPPVEEKWEDVSKKSGKRGQHHSNHSNSNNYHHNNSGGNNDHRTGGGGYGGNRKIDDNRNVLGNASNGHHHGGKPRGGRGGGFNQSRGGRGGHGRYVAGGRGGGRDRDRDRGRYSGDGRRGGGGGDPRGGEGTGETEVVKKEAVRGPAPVKSERPLQGAWGQRATPAADDGVNYIEDGGDGQAKTSSQGDGENDQIAMGTKSSTALESEKTIEDVPVSVQASSDDYVIVGNTGYTEPDQSIQEQNHSQLSKDSSPEKQSLPAPTPSAPSGNVWATRGSAHLIQAEKPKPPPQRQRPQSSVHDKSKSKPRHQIQNDTPPDESSSSSEEASPIPVNPDINAVISDPQTVPSSTIEDLIANNPVPTNISDSSNTSPDNALDNGLSASVNGANINAAGWKPLSTTTNAATNTLSATVQANEKENGLIQLSPAIGPVSSSAPCGADEPLFPPEQLQQKQEDKTQAASEVASSVTAAIAPVVVSTPAIVEPLKTTQVLNMGHWETGEGEDSQNIDFAFGSYGACDDGGSVEDPAVIVPTTQSLVPPSTKASDAKSAAAAAAAVVGSTGISPARPPPGLGIGMPPLPDEIVSVHDLENKLETNASLKPSKKEDLRPSSSVVNGNVTEKTIDASGTSGGNGGSVRSDKVGVAAVTKNLVSGQVTAGGPSSTTATNMASPHEGFTMPMPPATMSQPSYNPAGYAMGGMYGYTTPTAHNGFMGVPTPAGPVLSSTGVLPKQQQQSAAGQQSVASGGVGAGQGSLYGNTTSSAPESAVPTAGGTPDVSNNPNTNAATGIPPGMHMPYNPNPAVFYGQQPYQMAGQPHASVGYGYGYGQFGSVQGFGAYQQVMGQTGGGYGPSYDDSSQHHAGSHNHNGNAQQGGYGKNGGGHNYRGGGGGGGGNGGGRNNHNHGHNHHGNHNHQYQNQYNHQSAHGGYGGQPYNMGYGEHFGQAATGGRGGYGPTAMDPYNMPSPYQSSGFPGQDDSDPSTSSHQLGGGGGGGGGGGKGKSKGGNNRGNGSGSVHGNGGSNFGNPNMNQYQHQGGHQVGGVGASQSHQQQNFLHGGGVGSDGGNGGGLSYQSWGGGAL